MYVSLTIYTYSKLRVMPFFQISKSCNAFSLIGQTEVSLHIKPSKYPIRTSHLSGVGTAEGEEKKYMRVPDFPFVSSKVQWVVGFIQNGEPFVLFFLFQPVLHN